MALDFQQTDTDATFGAIQACSSLSAGTVVSAKLCSVGGTAGTAETTASHPGSGSGTLRLIHFELDVAAGTSWDAGNWTVSMGVTTQSSQLIWDSVFICRVDSGGTPQETIASATGLGIKFNLANVSHTLAGTAQTPSAGDRVYIVVGCTNGQTMSNTVGITPSDIINSPFTSGGTDATATPGVIAATAALPAAGLNVTAGPDAIAATTAAPAAGVDVAASPATIAASAALPAATADTGGGAAIPSNPFGRYRAAGLTAGALSSWTDEGSGGNDLAQATGADQPVAEAAGFNGHDSVLFDGAGDHMQTAAYSSALAQPTTIVLMGEMVAVSSTSVNQICDGQSSSNRQVLVSAGNQTGDPLQVFAGSVVNSSLTLVGTEGDDFCMVAIFNGASSELRYNNGANLIASSPGANSLGGFTLGSRFDGVATSPSANIRIVEALIYDRALDSTELTDLQSYFDDTYAAAGGDATATPAAIAATAALPAAGANISAAPAVTATTVALPQATAGQEGADTTATPATISAVIALPQAAADVAAGPDTITGTTALPAATVSGGATATPDAIAATAALPAATVIGTAVVTPAAIAAIAALPQATPETAGNATVTPDAIAAATAIPAASVSGTAVASPAAIAAVAALPQATPDVAGNATVTPEAVAALAALPAAGINTAVGPVTIPVVAALPQATASAGSDATAAPATIAGTATLPLATVDGGTGAQPATIAAVADLPQPALLVSVGPNVIAVAVSFPSASALGSLPDPYPFVLSYTESGFTLSYQETSAISYQEPA